MEKLESGAKKLGIHLTDAQLAQFQKYYETLIEWNTRFNLTAITENNAVQVNHFLDSLTAVYAWQPADSDRVIDIGTGAGLPGIPLKIAFPQISMTLLEATGKKSRFLEHAMQAISLTGLEVVNGRAEDIAHQSSHRNKYKVVMVRAVAALNTLAELTLPFCQTGGIVIAYKKGNIEQEITQAQKSIKICGGRIKTVQPVTLSEFPDNRVLVVIEKITATPELYPRRSGIPAKSPLI